MNTLAIAGLVIGGGVALIMLMAWQWARTAESRGRADAELDGKTEAVAEMERRAEVRSGLLPDAAATSRFWARVRARQRRRSRSSADPE